MRFKNCYRRIITRSPILALDNTHHCCPVFTPCVYVILHVVGKSESIHLMGSQTTGNPSQTKEGELFKFRRSWILSIYSDYLDLMFSPLEMELLCAICGPKTKICLNILRHLIQSRAIFWFPSFILSSTIYCSPTLARLCAGHRGDRKEIGTILLSSKSHSRKTVL